jgi:hypothetical protein
VATAELHEVLAARDPIRDRATRCRIGGSAGAREQSGREREGENEERNREAARDLEANGQAAIVFARPPDERACQVKGVFVGGTKARTTDRSFVLAQWDRWMAWLETIGIPRATMATWQTWPCVAIRVRVTALFNQTPGPGAGAALP